MCHLKKKQTNSNSGNEEQKALSHREVSGKIREVLPYL